MTIFHWLGQACFLITTLAGTPILLDPVAPPVGYKIAANSIPAKYVLISHSHFDHNYRDAAKERSQDYTSGGLMIFPPMLPESPRELGVAQEKVGRDEIGFRDIFAWHDNVQGKKRGSVVSCLMVGRRSRSEASRSHMAVLVSMGPREKYSDIPSPNQSGALALRMP